jgi:hypothetical protein
MLSFRLAKSMVDLSRSARNEMTVHRLSVESTYLATVRNKSAPKYLWI